MELSLEPYFFSKKSGCVGLWPPARRAYPPAWKPPGWKRPRRRDIEGLHIGIGAVT